MTAPQHPFRHAYTMIEILIAVTLSMLLMLAVTNLFSRVGGMMSDTQATLIMAQNLSAVRNRLDSDLCNRTIEAVRPSLTAAPNGFFSYVEGPMWQPTEGDSRNANWGDSPWCSWNIAYNPDEVPVNRPRSGGDDTAFCDQTVGDLDDVLSFTVEYKNVAGDATGKTFRARAIAPSGHLAVVESNAAEVHWFVRGNTLYRRTLLIENFSEPGQPGYSLHNWMTNLPTTANCIIGNAPSVPFTLARYLNPGAHVNPRGYYTFFDVSTRVELMNPSGILEFHANQLFNLAQRENRFGIFRNPNPVNSATGNYYEFYDQAYPEIRFPFNPYDPNPGTSTAQTAATAAGKAWYFLRMPTQKETSHENWAAGVTLPTDPAGMTHSRGGIAQNLYNRTSTDPYIDFWAAPDIVGGPNAWSALDAEINTLGVFDGPRYTDDVVLTNVIAFDVKAWDDLEQRYLDLGEIGWEDETFHFTSEGASPTTPHNRYADRIGVRREDLISNNGGNPNTWLSRRGLYTGGAVWGQYNTSTGAYVHAALVDGSLSSLPSAPAGTATIRWNFNMSANNVNPQLACVYDTWTDVYEVAAVPTTAFPPYNLNGTTTYTPSGSGSPAASPLDWACPPPYGDTPLKGVQVTIRTFDPRSGHIREAKVVRNLQVYD